ncbi:imidazole glycerol phosphate synthase subunit HisH [Haliovirga abyssi]|uniref:Imidazole glycerol phosphate synthase subunit HisH n=1 Tax=Haliovirga abyssi TaxID=2996794 RepID=A0AAU9DHY1_9FUSO|nr:imidazole glycerol phosphate synthase subunit HisH [Haliovirga abyssi]BDU51172.1 imidazole glycerol phosphate synthase subunit HisH [Haliovirga abyssi]
MIIIIDYKMGNLPNVKRALNLFTDDVEISSDINKIRKADKLILPGVGAFGDAMKNIKKMGLKEVIIEEAKKKPLLGICLGLQILFEKSEEDPSEEGLGLIKGEVLKFKNNTGLKVPEIGWNNIKIKKGNKILTRIKDNSYFYFVHSYYVKPSEDVTIATTDYGIEFTSAIEKGNIMATQFHPEKSHDEGLIILENFINL